LLLAVFKYNDSSIISQFLDTTQSLILITSQGTHITLLIYKSGALQAFELRVKLLRWDTKHCNQESCLILGTGGSNITTSKNSGSLNL